VTKRERTRASLLAAALELFEERGFDGTTVAAIAERAGVSEMTFFRHFASKDSVLVDDPYDPLIAEGIAASDPGLGPLAAVRAGIAASWSAVPPPAAEAVRERLRIAAATPSLRGAIARNSAGTEQAIAGALRARGVPRRESLVIAAAVVAALNAALLDWSAGDRGEDLGNAILSTLDLLAGAS
jgi:AcrR family transcriptional regulator